MNKEFIPYEQAIELKQLGFDEHCFGYFNKTWSKENELLFPQYAGELENWNNTQHLCSAPLYQQAFRWFREKYGLDYWIKKDWEDGKCLGYEGTTEETDGFRDCGTHPTYEETEHACLLKLIELAKQK